MNTTPLALLLAAACADAPLDSGLAAPPATAHWMADVFADRAEIEVGRVLLPGAFNASSYACAVEHGMSPDAPEAVRAIWGDDPGDADNRARVVGWARTQDRPLGEQLLDGVRFVEINVTLKDGVVTTWHSVYGVPVGEVLDELVDFLVAWPDEVVVLTFGVSLDAEDWGLLADALAAPRAGGVTVCDRVYDGPEPAAQVSLAATQAAGRNLIWAPQGELRGFFEARGDCALTAGETDRVWSITATPDGVEAAIAASVDGRDPQRLLINDFVFSLDGASSVLDQARYIAAYPGVREASAALGFSGDLPSRLIDTYDVHQDMNVLAGAYYPDTTLIEAAIAANEAR
ncbi:MAG: hypothetical protein H6739_29075 [Alphaproteobacteria bacterium]|nr:hypothetical protein [Alphaproteobacteria bacterium]